MRVYFIENKSRHRADPSDRGRPQDGGGDQVGVIAPHPWLD